MGLLDTLHENIYTTNVMLYVIWSHLQSTTTMFAFMEIYNTIQIIIANIWRNEMNQTKMFFSTCENIIILVITSTALLL